MEVFVINSRIPGNGSYFDSLPTRICIISSKGDDIKKEQNDNFSLYKIVEKHNHIIFKEILFAMLSLKEGATFALDGITINSRNKQPSHANESVNNFDKAHVCNHVPHRKCFNIEANKSVNELDSLSATLFNNRIFKERSNEKNLAQK